MTTRFEILQHDSSTTTTTMLYYKLSPTITLSYYHYNYVEEEGRKGTGTNILLF